MRFAVYLVAVLLSSGMKVAMPKGDGTMAVNFPFILLGIVQLSPGQAIALAALSVIAQCRIRVIKPFTFVQIAFNVANVITATALATLTFLSATRIGTELAPALALAATTYFFANTIPVALVIAWSKGEAPVALWRREFPWYLPFYLVGAVLAAVADLISVRFGWTTSLLLVPVIYTIHRAYRAQMAMVRDRQIHLEETEALHLRTIEGLAMAIEAKDHNTHDHLVRVRMYVAEIGVELGITELEMHALMTASFLHDIGKLAVPEHIINKPGKLTPEEFEKIKIHPVVGADILERVRFPYPVVPIVRSHHEAWDGSGYPDGLKGEEIPIGARILSAVDCFDALASDRPYRKALPIGEAMAMVRSKAGIQFDPRVVAVLEKRHVELEERARLHGKGLEPLNIDVTVARGEAPGAGFQQDNESSDAVARELASGEAARLDALNHVAAASQEAQAIFEMSQTLGASLSPDETISVMSSRLRHFIPFDCFAFYLKTGDILSVRYIDGHGTRSFSARPIPLGEGLSGWVAQSGRPSLNGNPKVEPNYEAGRDATMELSSALSLPLFNLTGDIFGVLTIYACALDAFSRDHLRILQAVEAKYSLTLQNVLSFGSAEKDLRVDVVTQLPNTRQFFPRMEADLIKASKGSEQLGVVVCNLNSLKAISERYGPKMASELLRSVADGFRACCHSYDSVARIGVDEFVFLLPGIDMKSCTPQLQLIEETVRHAATDLKIEMNISVSLGASFFPADGNTAEELLGLADRRMYFHKRKYFEAGASPIDRPRKVAEVA
ncbi:HD domain-containing phosphohydrolase [Granulicella sibirica]|uniref:HD domain-containing phosphohydrolase n=1 Tax=Granulicella sibirica TaxID=2479048 RepID=UPI0013757FAA|nr:HD domain-containing phosphohydrolase [Granulicella sibirica]